MRRASQLSLISEAVRGEGAILVDETGRRFMADMPRAANLRRAMSSRAPVLAALRAGHRIFLDARGRSSDFAARFPAVTGFAAPLASTR